MPTLLAFGEVLEAADSLSLDEQETLIDILQRRMIQQRRAELVQDIQSARKEFQSGHCQPATPSQIMKDILS